LAILGPRWPQFIERKKGYGDENGSKLEMLSMFKGKSASGLPTASKEQNESGTNGTFHLVE